MAGPRTLRSFIRLLSYPDEQTLEASELLFLILQGELPEAAREISQFGAFVEQHQVWELEEAFTRTFDVNPACALEVGWHLFGEEYARGMFLVRMREEMRKFGLVESQELPDHITHVLAVVASMTDEEAARFVTACVLPAVIKMKAALDKTESPYAHVVSCLASVLQHVWGEGGDLIDGSETRQPDADALPEGVDLLHAYPVAGLDYPEPAGACGSGGGPEFVQLSLDGIPSRSGER